MTTLTKTQEARIVAQKLIDLELSRQSITAEQAELKDTLAQLISDGAEDTYSLNQGVVFLSNTTKYSVPDGLQQEIITKVKDASKLNPEIIDAYFQNTLKLSRRALKTLRKSGDPDLSNLVLQEEKSSIKIKVAE